MRFLSLVVFILLFCNITYALDIEKGIEKYDSFTLEYAIEDVDFATIRQKNFTEITGNYFSFGYIFTPVWFHLEVRNTQPLPQELYLEFGEAFADECDFYIQDASGYMMYKNGLQVDLENRSIKNPLPAVLLRLESGETKQIYIRYKSRFGSFGSFKLFSPEAFFSSSNSFAAVYALYFGAVLVIAVYNLFLYFSLRDSAYLYYVGYVGVFALWVFLFCGFSLYVMDGAMHYMLHFSTPFAFFFMTLFTQKVLDTKEKLPKAHMILWLFATLLFIYSVWIIFDLETGYYLTNINGLLLLPMYIFVALMAIREGIKTAKYYLFALAIYLSSMITLASMAVGMLEYNVYIKYSYLVGSLLEIILFSFLLAYRINVLRQEKFEAQRKLLEMKEDEAARLEARVDEKTAKLQEMVQERELLIKEIHHRVKNNLQTVIGLLVIQKSGTEDTEIKRWINETASRIKSISVVHELLYSAGDLSKISAKEYLEKILVSIDAWLGEGSVELKSEILDMELNIDDAITIGIIVVEIVTNSLKHAFTDISDRQIEIRFFKENENAVLEICDNGRGFDLEKVNIEKSLGIRLVQNMSKKLQEGKSEFMRKNGTVFRLEFVC